MGMDVYGINPRSEHGVCFRNNCWFWHPLADYIQANAAAIACKCKAWHTNDGEGLSDGFSKLLAEVLKSKIASGHAALYAAERAARLAAIPLQSCRWCDGTGTRADAVGVANGFDKLKWCNGCDGKGLVKHDATHYHFTVENVAEFAAFLEDCGGFKIL